MGHGITMAEDTVIVAINNTRRAVTLDVPVQDDLVDGTHMRAVWDTFETRVGDGRISGVCIPARAGTVLEIVFPLG
jgi:hypothetical protein